MNASNNKKRESILRAIIQELKEDYDCHTIILYGSRARGDYTDTSDYDIAGVSCSIQEKQWIARFDTKHQIFHDIFVFPEQELIEPNQSHLQMSDGIVLIESNHFGTNLLKRLQTLTQTSYQITENEITSRKVWYQKMLSRAAQGDVEGKYRQIWIIHTLLEDYFCLRKQRYLGPKKAFQYLEKHQPGVFTVFQEVLADANDLDKLKKLVEIITSINDV